MNRSRLTFSFLISNFLFLIFLASCSIQKQISKSANQLVLKDSSLLTAHIGISIYETETGKYWYNYQGGKYFVPASNTKIPTCYAAMKYLGDSLNGWTIKETTDSVYLKPGGDPTFLHPEFKSQLVFQYLKKSTKKLRIVFLSHDRFEPYGKGWSWDDYQESYLAERARMPIFGNLAVFEMDSLTKGVKVNSRVFIRPPFMDEPMIQLIGVGKNFTVNRSRDENKFSFSNASAQLIKKEIPFKSNYSIVQYKLLLDTLNLSEWNFPFGFAIKDDNYKKFKTQPTDSLLKPMMHRSDNFFAEQSLLMVSNELLGVMNDEKIIDTLLKTDFKDLPQRPRWADGSGLSRYNLFTPQDFVFILNKMKNEFGMERIKVIFPTGGKGTITNYYKADSSFIFAKTGTLSGVVALSGYLYTKKGKLLIFSTLVNNHQASATAVRRSIEKFVQGIRNKY